MVSQFKDVLTNTFFDKRVEQLFDLAARVDEAFSAAGLEYRVVGGLATYLYVEEKEPDAGRLTRDIDIAVREEDLKRIAAAVEPYGLEYRHVTGADMLVQKDHPTCRRAVHLIFAEAAPELETAPSTIRGIRVVPLRDLVRMKLTSYRLKDEVHIKDLDEAGLITREIESTLTPELRARLQQTRTGLTAVPLL